MNNYTISIWKTDIGMHATVVYSYKTHKTTSHFSEGQLKYLDDIQGPFTETETFLIKIKNRMQIYKLLSNKIKK